MSADRIRRGFHRVGLIGAIPLALVALGLAAVWQTMPDPPLRFVDTPTQRGIPLPADADEALVTKVSKWDDAAIKNYDELMMRGPSTTEVVTSEVKQMFMGHAAWEQIFERRVTRNYTIAFGLGAFAWYLVCWTVGWLIRGFMRDA